LPEGIYTSFSGPVTSADLLQHVVRVGSDPRFDQLRFSILDFSDATDEVDDAELTAVYAHMIGQRHANDRVRVAAITTDASVIAHIERFPLTIALREPIRIFATANEARDWALAASR
jgi:hypothetical protein